MSAEYYTQLGLRHVLMLLKRFDECNREVTFIDQMFQYSCLMPSSGVVFINGCQVVSRYHHNLRKGWLHNHAWIFILIRMPDFVFNRQCLCISSIRWRNLTVSLFTFKTTLVPFLRPSFLFPFLFFFRHRTFADGKWKW